MLKILGVVVACLVVAAVVVLILAATKPDTFRVRRSLAIKAPPEKIFPLINDFRQWTSWSPYEHRDPAMKRIYGASTSGKGATYAWEGDKNVGAGSMEVTEATAPSRIALKLDFSRPFEAHNMVTFPLAPQGELTTVTWDMRGPVPFTAKIMHVFLNMDKMVGTDFEAGLANLKAAAEAR